MKFEKMTEEEALEKLRSEKNHSNTVSEFLYYILGDAQPGIKGEIEKFAAKFAAAGHNVGRVIAEVEKNPKDRAKFIQRLQEIAQKTKSTSSKPTSHEEEEK